MDISFDPGKSERNETERGLPFTLVEQLDWSGAMIEEDIRKEYGERRYRVLGLIGGRLHAAVFTPRGGKVHVISLRKANPREVKHYEQKT
ncbi:MAG: BrnT family toxin [Rhodocyclaceae bacterium]|nr:BrnT family toxin [Rhodocyclaceae bacterium]